MIRSVVRALTALTAVLLVFAVIVSSGGLSLAASAAVLPAFLLETDSDSARTGDFVTVSLYVDNLTNSSLSNFDGVISFNDAHLKYVDFTYPDSMNGKLTCIDNRASSTSEISIAFADTSKSVIPSGTTHKLALQVRFQVVSSISGNALVSCRINSWNGSSSTQLGVSQVFITVSPTQPTPATTTTSSTTQTSATAAPTTNQRSSDARLQSLSVIPGTLSPEFNPEFVAYTVNVENEIATVRIAATTNSNVAVISGTGVKDLAVGQNTFTITVTAEDGTVKQYGVVVIRAAETSAAPVDIVIDATSTFPTLPSEYLLEPVPQYEDPSSTAATLPITPETNKVIEGGGEASQDIALAKIIGIIFAEVALFMFGFLAGFFLDKNIKKKNLAEMAYGPLDQQPRMEYIPAPAQPYPPQPDYQQYQPQPEYQEYSSSNDNSYSDDGFPQYGVYDEPAFDEYGNPIQQDGQYNDQYNDPYNDQYGGYQGYGDNGSYYGS